MIHEIGPNALRFEMGIHFHYIGWMIFACTKQDTRDNLLINTEIEFVVKSTFCSEIGFTFSFFSTYYCKSYYDHHANSYCVNDHHE